MRYIFKNLCFKVFVRIHPHVVHILQAIEADAENLTHHGSKTTVILHIRNLAKIKQGFTGNEFMYNNW